MVEEAPRVAEVLQGTGEQGTTNGVAEQGVRRTPRFQRRHELLEEEPEAPPLTRITLLIHAAVRVAPNLLTRS